MRIDPASRPGRRLVGLGVTEEQLRFVRFYAFDLQLGGAVTLAVPFWGCVILARRTYLQVDSEDSAVSAVSLSLLRHEMCHVRQRRQWGFLRYVWRHSMARLKTRSIMAAGAETEMPCYEAQAEAYKKLMSEQA